MCSLQLSTEHKAVIGYADFNQTFSNASVMSTSEIPQDTQQVSEASFASQENIYIYF